MSKSGDTISRQDAIEAVATVTMSIHLSNVLCDKLLALPSAEPKTGWFDKNDVEAFRMAIEALSAADRPKMDKEYLIDLIQEAVYDGEACAELIGLVDRHTDGYYVNTRPTGEWIRSHLLPNGWDCSHCDAPVMTDDISEMLFCPHCGAKMIGNVRNFIK